MLLQLTHHLLDEGRRHGKRDADTAAGGREDRGVHADDLAVQIEGRATGVAAIHRCIDLQIVIRTRANVPVVGRDDSASHRAAEAEGIADREHPVADAGVLVGELHVGELPGSLDLEERHVGASIGPDQVAGNLSRFSSGTEMSSASSTMWLVVTRYPSGEMKKPEPWAMVGCGC